MPRRRSTLHWPAALACCAALLAAAAADGPPLPYEPPCLGPVDPPTPRVTLRVRVVACSAPGRDIEYCICVHNTSAAAAHHVVVRNPLPANARFVRASPQPHALKPELRWDLGTMPPGCRREITLVLVPVGDGDVTSCARVQFEHGQCVTTRIARAAPPPMPPPDGPGRVEPVPIAAPRLALSMSGPTRQPLNQPATYRVTVTNTGNAPARNVLIDNGVPKGADFVTASEPGKFLEGQVAWLVGDLPPGQSRSVEVTLKAKVAGEICNRARALADGGLSATAELCTRFGGASALAIRLDDTRDPLPVGETTMYVIVVKNQGNLPVTNLKITARIPPQLVLVQANGAAQPPPKDQLPPQDKDGQRLPFAPLATLEPGAEARYEITVRALEAGDVRFQVEMTADQLEAGPVIRQESTQVLPVGK